MKFNDFQVFRNYPAESFLFMRRIIFSCIIITLLICILIIRLYHIQITHFDTYTIRSNENRIKIIPLPPKRGIIYDCHKLALALNRTVYHLEIIPAYTINLNKTIQELRSLLKLTTDDINQFEKSRKNSSQFISLTIKTNLTEKQQARFAVNQFRFKGVSMKKYQYRYYPYGSILTHVIGYISKINEKDIKNLRKQGIFQKYIATHNIGKLGIERYYENILHGIPGYKVIEVNNQGKIIRELYEKQPIPGKNIMLTLDLYLQQYITELLTGSRSSVVVINPRNGGIQALISYPSYDPNLFVNGISNKEYRLLLKNKDCPLLNRSIQGIYPPASTVKPYISVSALILGIINKNFSLYDPGWWQLPGSEKRFRDWKKWGHGKINITKALEESSDTFFYQIAYKMGIDNLSEWMTQFGYGKHTGIDLFEESTGTMPNKEWKIKKFNTPWYQGDTISVGIGQGYWTATPIQMSKALITLINDGCVKIPHLLDSILLNGHYYIPYNQIEYKQVGDPKSDVWKIAKDGMFGAANRPNGTVQHCFSKSSYVAAAKSGTAQLFSLKKNQKYDSTKISKYLKDHKLMTAFAPYDNPTVAVVVILENGEVNSTSIGAITKKILDYILLK